MAAPRLLVTKSEYSAEAIAVSLGLAIIKKAKANTWAEFMQMAARHELSAVEAVQAFALTPEQISLLGKYQQYVCLIQVAPSIVPSFCTECKTVSLQSKSTTKKCINTRGCKGSLVKPSAATGAKI